MPTAWANRRPADFFKRRSAMAEGASSRRSQPPQAITSNEESGDWFVIRRTRVAAFFRVFSVSSFRDPLNDFACCEMKKKANHEKTKVRNDEKIIKPCV